MQLSIFLYVEEKIYRTQYTITRKSTSYSNSSDLHDTNILYNKILSVDIIHKYLSECHKYENPSNIHNITTKDITLFLALPTNMKIGQSKIFPLFEHAYDRG